MEFTSGEHKLATIPYALILVPYSGLFSQGANFPEWAHDSGKFMLGCL